MDQAAERLSALARQHQIPLIFKSSFEKDNRTLPQAYRGPGIVEGLASLARLRERWGLTLLTDIHSPEDAAPAAEIVDVLQIPAFLCRQTRLLEAAGATGRAINLKRGQFASPSQLAGSVAKLRAAGANEIVITERGASFGYERLVCDFTQLAALRELCGAVVFDAGHAANAAKEIPVLARAATAAGADALFIEAHPEPRRALCDGSRMLSLEQLANLLPELLAIRAALAPRSAPKNAESV